MFRLIGVWLLLLLGDAFALLHAAPLPSPPIQVTDIEAAQIQPSVAAYGNKMILVRGFENSWSQSLDGGRTWVDRGPIVHYDDPVIFPSGEAMALCSDSSGHFFAVGPCQDRARTGHLGVLRGSFRDTTFSWDPPTVANLAPSSGASFEFVQIAWSPASLIVVYTEIVDASWPDPCPGRVKVVRSTDDGATWSSPLLLSGTFCSNSRLAVGPEGSVHVVWQDFETHRITARRSDDGGATFGAPRVVAHVVETRAMPMGFPKMRRAVGTSSPHWSGPNELALAIDHSTSETRGRMYVAWVEQAEGTTLPIGATVRETEPNGTPGSADTIIVGQALAGALTSPNNVNCDSDWWVLDGVAGSTISIGGFGSNRGGCGASGNVRCASSTGLELSGFHLGCLGEDVRTIYTFPATGPYYVDFGCQHGVGYHAEISEFQVSPQSVARDHRDVVMAWSADGGQSWSTKVRASDGPPGSDDAVPTLAVDGKGRMHLTWYDRRTSPPECSATVHTHWRHSSDGGITMSPSRPISTTAADLRTVFAQRGNSSLWMVGDHMTLLPVDGRVHAFWVQPKVHPTYGASDVFTSIIEEDRTTDLLISGFGAMVDQGGVRLWWRLASTEGVLGFRIARAPGSSDAFVPLRGPDLIPATAAVDYQWIDDAVVPGAFYRYRLEVVTQDSRSWYGGVEIAASARPGDGLRGSPNPFTTSIRIEAELDSGPYDVAVYDVSGHIVRRLLRGAPASAPVALSWDGRDTRGRRMPPGLYLIRAIAGRKVRTLRATLLE